MAQDTGNATSKWPFRWDLLLRYRFIETIVLWEGRLTTRHLCDTFGIGRAARKLFKLLREMDGENPLPPL